MTATINASTTAGVVTTADTSGILQLQTNGTAALTVDASQNVGIGTSSPNYLTTFFKASLPALQLANSTSGTTGSDGLLIYLNGANATISNEEAGFLVFQTSGTERARIDSSGNLLVNTTTAIGTITTRNTGGYTMGSVRTGTGGEGHISFRNANGEVGSIQTSGSATSYVTSSDYRLKEAIAPMTGALAKVALLKPCTYKWKVDGSDGQGFIAHELDEVVPGCVVGEKDAVQEEQYEVTPAVKDEEGNIVTEAVMGTRTVPAYQGIDTSFLVATLTAAIQELKAIVDGQAVLIAAQGAEIAALKGATA